MSSAAVSLATAQPRSSRPSTSGRKPCGSRAAYRVCSSMKTSENAPRTRGSAARALSATLSAAQVGEQRREHVGVGGAHRAGHALRRPRHSVAAAPGC